MNERDPLHPTEQHVPRRLLRSDETRSSDSSLLASVGNSRIGRVLHSQSVQRAGGASVQRLDESVARAIEERRGRGKPLDDRVREQMEESLGHELSDVRVHTDGAAHELTEAVSARAFTTGADVFFKQGSYDPGSAPGRKLLAHELTHVVQQRVGATGLAPGEVSHPSDAAEQHAADVGREVAGQAPLSTSVPMAAGVARQQERDDLEEGVAGDWEPGATQRQATDEDLEQEAE